MRVVIIDNYDSFTYNLVHTVEQYCEDLTVIRNDSVNLEELNSYDCIIISPGPGLPQEVTVLEQILSIYSMSKPILGVCLGMQAIGIFFGAQLYNLSSVDHGIPKQTLVTVPDEILFKGVPSSFPSGRYHSWALSRDKFPEDLMITATDPKGIIMAIRHRHLNVCGVQFHPESIMTPCGNQMLKNWISENRK